VEVVAPLYRAHVAAGTLAFPDLYVLLGACEPELRARRAADLPARARRNFETHLRLVAPQRRWFAALQAASPGRVLMLDTSGRRDALVADVLAAVAALPRDVHDVPDALPLFDRMAAWAASA
jgi:thymidylate kinase